MEEWSVLNRFALRVYGCQMNVYDADRLRTTLIERGWEETAEADADLVLYVACSIRDKAEHKVVSELGRHADIWESGRSQLVGLVGCMAQRVGPELMGRFPWLRLIAGPRHLGFVPEAAEELLRDGEPRMFMDDDPRALADLECPPLRRINPYKAFVTIAHGCDNYCTYCIVPYVRGRFQSRAPEQILSEIESLVAAGTLEVTLLGQNVNSYGTDFTNGYTFARLLRDACRIPGLRLLRFATNHPKDFTDDVIEVMAEEERICPGINLPIQSGSDRVLKLMNRGYDVATYAGRVERIRRVLPEAGLTSDLIVGFPGETEADFQASVDALERFRFDLVHSAAYSPRPGTKAADVGDQLSRDVKKRRLQTVNEVQSRIAREINATLVGREYSILVDGMAPKGEGLVQGRTPSDKVVIMEGDPGRIGTFVRTEITSADNWSLRGKIIGSGESGS